MTGQAVGSAVSPEGGCGLRVEGFKAFGLVIAVRVFWGAGRTYTYTYLTPIPQCPHFHK